MVITSRLDATAARIYSRFWRATLFIYATLALVGCVPHVELLPSATGTPVSVATVAPDEHALSIIDVDFDPPLDSLTSLPGGVTLLVAIANHGLSAESNVKVSARLLDPADRDRELAGEVVSVRSLAAGEVRIVRFTQVSDLPRRTGYKLIVRVEPAPGEANTIDNVHSYEIVMHPSK